MGIELPPWWLHLGSSPEGTGKDWRRWLMLFIFCVLSIFTNINGFAFASIANKVEDYFDETERVVDADAVNMLTAVILITAIPLFLFGPIFFTRMSLYVTFALLAWSGIIGTIIRYAFIAPNGGGYIAAMIGQIIIACGQFTTWAGPTRLSSTWFVHAERGLATSLAAMSNLVGLAISYILGPVMVQVPDDLPFLLLVEMIVTVACSIIGLLLFRSAPAHPQEAYSAVNDDVEQPVAYWPNLKTLVKTKNYLLISTVFGLGYAYFSALFTLLNQMMVPQDYTESNIALFGNILIFTGIVGAFIAGIMVDKTRRYREILLVAEIGSIGSLLWFLFAVKPDNLISVTLSLALMGFSTIALTPVALEVTVEYTYPIPEIMSSGILLAWSSLMSVVFVFVMSALQDAETGDMFYANVFALSALAICVPATWFTDHDYRRLASHGDRSLQVSQSMETPST